MIRILTEDRSREVIYRLLQTYAAESFTVTPAVGFWKGVEEKAIAIDIVGASLETGVAIAQAIKTYNHQQIVLVLNIPTESRFV